MIMASKIQKPNLKMNEIVLSSTKLNIKMSAITVRLITDTPNINKTNALSNKAANSNIKYLVINGSSHNNVAEI